MKRRIIDTVLGDWQQRSEQRLDEIATKALDNGHLQAYRLKKDDNNTPDEARLLQKYTYNPPNGQKVQVHRFRVRDRESMDDEPCAVVVYFTETHFIAEVLAEDW